MSIKNIDFFSFRSGIEAIIHEDITSYEKLPESSLITPSDEHIERRVEKLFEIKSLDEQILKSLKPELSDKTIQNPLVYYDMIDSIHQSLNNWLENPISLDENFKKDIIKNSYELFTELKNLFELLNMYRNILHKA